MSWNYDESDNSTSTQSEYYNWEGEESTTPNETDYEPTDEEREALCRAFTLLDIDGDGVIETKQLEELLVSLGRLPLDDELANILSYSHSEGCEGANGMDFEGFKKYITEQLRNTNDENELRNAFQVFDTTPPTGKVDLNELRHYMKRKGLVLTDDEIDFLYKEEDYWMLEEKNKFDYEQLISKIMGKPTCTSKFLNC